MNTITARQAIIVRRRNRMLKSMKHSLEHSMKQKKEIDSTIEFLQDEIERLKREAKQPIEEQSESF